LYHRLSGFVAIYARCGFLFGYLELLNDGRSPSVCLKLVSGGFTAALGSNNLISYYPIGRWWDVMIKFVTPVVLLYMLVQNVLTEIKQPYGGYSLNALLIFGWGSIILGLILSFFISKRSWHDASLVSPVKRRENA
jgi:hypothetical protein